MANQEVIRLGLVGCGVVGTGILRILNDHRETIEARLGARLEVTRLAASNPDKERDPLVPPDRLCFDPMEVALASDVDLVIEVMGGTGTAGEVIRAALTSGKHVVTANKALIAESGEELLQMAEENHVDLYFEAAVGGGIPIIRVLREALTSDRIVALRGIVNGTSNYILSRMQTEGLSFEDALSAAQSAGYAEADPTLDINGGDARHKLTILATLAFGVSVTPDDIACDGIEHVSSADIRFADDFGFVIKHLAIGRKLEDGSLDLRVQPSLVPRGSVLAQISGALNAVYLEGAMLGPSLISGLGAGALPTAMSVMSDVVDVARNLRVGAHGRVPSRVVPGRLLEKGQAQDITRLRAEYYLRFTVEDRPGVLARVAGVLGAFDVSIQQMVQAEAEGANDGRVDLVLMTHEARERDVRAALQEIDSLSHVLEAARALRIERG